MNAYWDTYATGWGVNDWPDETKFRGWTQYAEHGPGPDFAGAPKTVLELGCGDATELAYFARQGAEATGIDLAGAHVERARERCEGLDARLFQQSAAEFLTHTTEGFDAVISRFGAVWFDDPRQLFPLIRRRMNPGGVLLFTHGPAVEGCYGPQGIYPGALRGRPIAVKRWSYTPRTYEDMLRQADFAAVEAQVYPAPDPEDLGTLMVRAWVAQ
ncbi:class I SAM-dependent methyltransferase [Streptomyces sp. NBC_00539]|uniref:class I SAM-dependent methyltransferase n=1 Tax=Streptomyces sp. NBC_00539 TaxID=2975770 RepID=UPI002E8209F5|nr:class I SAM-dependent methyltransferase [Streptomyces sp. NBC_00539]WUC64135.1 class I SAM-dependent methyltransferase [Streptomyces sp. NBC_00539]